MKINYCFILTVIGTLFLSASKAADYNIIQYGARADYKTINTKSIQSAIDDCYKSGGGRVIVPTGGFITGTIYLKTNVTLFLEKGATLYGSIDSIDYPLNAPASIKSLNTHSANGKPKRNFALIYAESQDNIGISGEGTINGNGNQPLWQRGDNGPNRPKLIFFISCRQVVVENVQLTNSAFWMQDYEGCDGVRIKGITVVNHANWNNDGIDIDSKNVTVSDCNIDSDDDGICLKSYLNDRPCENVSVTNCVVASNCNAIKMGTPGYVGFKNITISNCSVNASKYNLFRKWTQRYKQITTNPSMVTGLSIECVDGGSTDNIIVNNITMKATQTPVFIKVGNRPAKFKDEIDLRVSSMKNIIVSNIIADVHSRRSCSVTAYPGAVIENIQLHNMIFNVISTGVESDKEISVKENETGYPSPHMFGDVLPCYGFYLRHINNIDINDIQINLAQPDARYAIVTDDVSNARFNNVYIKNNQKGTVEALSADDLKLISSDNVFLNNTKIFKK